MKIRIEGEKQKETKITLEGEGHTFCNVLQSALLGDEGVEFVGYNVPHPLKSEATIYVRVKKGSPKEALHKAAEFIRKQTDEFQKTWKEAIGA